MTLTLSDLCSFADGRVAVADLDVYTYISTENMLPDKEGTTRSVGLPTISQVQAYQTEDVLVSNIRPYFRKIWIADRNGGCSNDVLVLRAKKNCNPNFLYYLLSDDNFFDYATATAKGTKMPRGDKGAIMRYEVPDLPLDIQIGIADTLSALDARIAINKAINHHLEQMAQAIFKNWFVDLDPWGGVMPEDWLETELDEVTTLSAGGDKPVICSPTPTDKCTIPIFSNGIDNFGLYGYTELPKITEESVTVSARGTIGFVCLRQDSFVPIVRLITAIPDNNFITAKYLYLYLKSINIAGVGTTQQQLTVPDFKKYRILVPSFEAVNGFTQIVNPIFDTIRHKRYENARLVETRDTLLPHLMSGELSISE